MNIYDAYAKKDLDLKNYKIRIKDLEEENKKLKDNNYNELQRLWLENYELREENKKLKNELMEDMKTETKLNEEIKKLKSREEKLIAYYKWYVDKEHNLTEVEDIITENIKLKEKLNKLEDVKKLLRKIVMDLTKLDKLKKIVFKDDADLED